MNSASVKELQSCSPPNQQEAEVCWDHPTSSEHRPLQPLTLLLCNSTPLNAHRRAVFVCHHSSPFGFGSFLAGLALVGARGWLPELC